MLKVKEILCTQRSNRSAGVTGNGCHHKYPPDLLYAASVGCCTVIAVCRTQVPTQNREWIIQRSKLGIEEVYTYLQTSAVAGPR